VQGVGDKQAGWEAFAAADWAAAQAAFASALEEEPGDPEALDGLGQSLWWLGERDAAIDRRREAYAEYRRRGDAPEAGRLATYLAGEHRIDGQQAAASGWLARARRLLDGAELAPAHGWLAIEDAKRAPDAANVERHARIALDVAQQLADPDVECMALAQLGRALVRQGRVDEGVALLDEAMTVALGGETTDPLACGDACCTTLVVCDALADLQRAAEWCEAVVAFTDRRHFTPVQSWCRTVYAGVLLRAGDWQRAETVLAESLRGHDDRRRSGGRAFPLATLAELRLRQGRTEEAEQLLDGLDDQPEALPALVHLHVQRGDVPHARALLERDRGIPEERVLALEAEVAVAAGDAEAAARAGTRLRRARARRPRRRGRDRRRHRRGDERRHDRRGARARGRRRAFRGAPLPARGGACAARARAGSRDGAFAARRALRTRCT
jgi:tetratricopeptide (TPR) repeat protein